METVTSASAAPVPLEAVLSTAELSRRSSRPPDYEAETKALAALARKLTSSPDSILQTLADTTLQLCGAHSAGISLLEEEDRQQQRFRWHAVAGQWSPLLWTTTPRGHSPCGTVLDRNATLLFSYAHRYYTQFAGVDPLLVEALLVPFHVAGRAVGTVWVVAHDEGLQFDAEDKRMLESLATFAATAYQVLASMEALRESERRLREANERKDEFLAMLAHELRNPLAPIENAVRFLSLIGSKEPRIAQAREIIERQTGHLTRLVDDLLDVSRITRGKISLHREPVVLEAIVNAAVEVARPLIDRLGHTLTVSHMDKVVRLEGDFARLVQVVSNLLTNAAKFTPARGCITVTTQQTDGNVVVRVRDTGVGLPSELQARVFDLFVQGDGGRARSRGGLGIGLTLVKRIVELHDGTVQVNSDGADRGSEFVVTLPAKPPKLALRAPRATPKLAGGRKPLRILLVEDNPDTADSFTLLLELGGHAIRAAHDGRAALELIGDFSPDIAFVDVGLPGMDGYELAGLLRAHPGCQSSVLVALTGYGRAEDKRRATQAGFDHHMTKPVDFDAIDRLLGNVS